MYFYSFHRFPTVSLLPTQVSVPWGMPNYLSRLTGSSGSLHCGLLSSRPQDDIRVSSAIRRGDGTKQQPRVERSELRCGHDRSVTWLMTRPSNFSPPATAAAVMRAEAVCWDYRLSLRVLCRTWDQSPSRSLILVKPFIVKPHGKGHWGKACTWTTTANGEMARYFGEDIPDQNREET